jgi:hypothetical protein
MFLLTRQVCEKIVQNDAAWSKLYVHNFDLGTVGQKLGLLISEKTAQSA